MEPVLLIYQTYNSAVPSVMGLPRNYTDDDFIRFIDGIATALSAAQGGYDHIRMTMQVFVKTETGYTEKLAREV